MNTIIDNPEFHHVDRAPYQLAHLLRRLPEGFSAHSPVAKADRPVVEAISKHACNANDTLMHGLAALGHVMMLAGLNEEGAIPGSHIARLGELITHLAVEAEAMQELDWVSREALEVGKGEQPSPSPRNDKKASSPC